MEQGVLAVQEFAPLSATRATVTLLLTFCKGCLLAQINLQVGSVNAHCNLAMFHSCIHSKAMGNMMASSLIPSDYPHIFHCCTR